MCWYRIIHIMPPVTKFKISACSPSHIISHRPRKCNPISEKYPSKITVIINRNLVFKLCKRENCHEQIVNFSENHARNLKFHGR